MKTSQHPLLYLIVTALLLLSPLSWGQQAAQPPPRPQQPPAGGGQGRAGADVGMGVALGKGERRHADLLSEELACLPCLAPSPSGRAT